jgi:hypothetical protein
MDLVGARSDWIKRGKPLPCLTKHGRGSAISNGG